MSITLVGVILMYILVLTRSRSDASVLTSSIAALYCLYLQWSALSSDQTKKCNKNLNTSSNIIAQIVLGLCFTVTALVIISTSTKKSDEENATARVGGHIIEKEEDLEDKEDIETTGKD